jgi:hypothetical protein
MDNENVKEKRFPVIYYDIHGIAPETLKKLSNQLEEYFKREEVPFLLLPKDVMDFKLLTKKETLGFLNKMIEEVKSWE